MTCQVIPLKRRVPAAQPPTALAMHDRIVSECQERGAEMPKETHMLLLELLADYGGRAGLPF